MKGEKMKAKIFIITIIFSLTIISPAAEKTTDTPGFRQLRNYGGAVVEKVLDVEDENLYTFRCNIKDWPAIIGKDIPVTIKNIEPPSIVTEQNMPNKFFELQVQKFLEEKLADAKNIDLERIQRGERFCLIADVMLDGKNLSRILIENGFAEPLLKPEKTNTRQTRRYPQPATRQERISPQPQNKQQITNIYVASKSSKIFHKDTCFHAKRISPENLVRFNTRQEALQNGRRPCKTCSP